MKSEKLINIDEAAHSFSKEKSHPEWVTLAEFDGTLLEINTDKETFHFTFVDKVHG